MSVLQPVGRHIRLVSAASPIPSLSIDNVRIYGHIAEEIDVDGDGFYIEDCGNALQSMQLYLLAYNSFSDC